jgi:type I restriction enzyme R subunit
MSPVVGQNERGTQDRIVGLFRDQLGYEYVGRWEYRENNSQIEQVLLEQSLFARGYDDALIGKAVDALKKVAVVGGGQSLYEGNRAVYELLRYGVKVKRGLGELFETVWLIDWVNPSANHFVVAEEVSIKGEHIKACITRRLTPPRSTGCSGKSFPTLPNHSTEPCCRCATKSVSSN